MMRSRHLRMSFEDFHQLPFRLGWKQEFINGHLVETPRQAMVHGTIPVAQRSIPSPVPLRPAAITDEEDLLPCFMAAFRNTFEFCDYDRKQFGEAARECLRYVFREPSHRWLPASRIALGPPGTRQAGKPIGAALVLLQSNWAFLDAVCVAPAWQRRGLATALVAAAIEALHQVGAYHVIVSRFFLGNEASCAWHRRFGFTDEPDLRLVQLYLRAATHELNRLREMGPLAPDLQRQLESDRDRCQARVDRLEARLRDGHESEADPWQKWPINEASRSFCSTTARIP
jgi:ribosomal protein S18 acetylase RimI-like enzyme